MYYLSVQTNEKEHKNNHEVDVGYIHNNHGHRILQMHKSTIQLIAYCADENVQVSVANLR